MRRLYVQIYATVVGVLVIFSLIASVGWWIRGQGLRSPEVLESASQFAAAVLPPAGTPSEEVRARLAELFGPFELDAALFSADGEEVASIGAPLPPPEPSWRSSRLYPMRVKRDRSRRGERNGLAALSLPDSRWFVVRIPHPPREHGRGVAGMMALAAIATGLGAYPLVRRLTRRVEALQNQVEAFGEGDLGARATVKGRDEIAQLAESFNRSAERIESLVEEKRRILAATSHELRTPLSRIRVALELLESDPRPELRSRIERDIRELDELIAELLVASRLDSSDYEIEREPVDLLALLAEEAARYDLEVSGDRGIATGDSRLLRRLIRNLLDNASRYAGGASDASVCRSNEGEWVLRVCDRGPGIAPDEIESIFEPFYRSRSRPADPSGIDATAGASGLGLSLVRRIAERHGGSVHCRAREGGGTIFEVRLPEPGPDPDESG